MSAITNVWQPSGLKTSSAVIKASAGILGGCVANGDGTNLATITVYDNATEGSGTEVCNLTTSGTAVFPFMVQCANGIYLKIAGTGAKGEVYYR